jgi:hypothetical protein
MRPETESCNSLIRDICGKTDERHGHCAVGSSHHSLIGSINKRGAAGTNGQAGDAKRGTGDAKHGRLRVSRHRRNPFGGSDLVRSVTRVTRVTRNRGPFPGGGCGGEWHGFSNLSASPAPS